MADESEIVVALNALTKAIEGIGKVGTSEMDNRGADAGGFEVLGRMIQEAASDIRAGLQEVAEAIRSAKG